MSNVLLTATEYGCHLSINVTRQQLSILALLISKQKNILSPYQMHHIADHFVTVAVRTSASEEKILVQFEGWMIKNKFCDNNHHRLRNVFLFAPVLDASLQFNVCVTVNNVVSQRRKNEDKIGKLVVRLNNHTPRIFV